MVFLLKFLFALFIVATAVVFYFGAQSPEFPANDVPPISEIISEEMPRNVISPPPLRREISSPSPASTLTRFGVIFQTNSQRAENGLLPLSENALLNSAAAAKLQDMFFGQYFAHVAADGTDAAKFASEAGFEFLIIGENLALGNFENDAALVQVWMDSPGHRANILHPKYLGIGAAVGRGMFEGRQTWLAVQIFGVSAAVCSQPDAVLRQTIENLEIELKMLENELNKRRGDNPNVN